MAAGSGGAHGAGTTRRTRPEVKGTAGPREAKMEKRASEASLDSWQVPTGSVTGAAGAASAGPIEP